MPLVAATSGRSPRETLASESKTASSMPCSTAPAGWVLPATELLENVPLVAATSGRSPWQVETKRGLNHSLPAGLTTWQKTKWAVRPLRLQAAKRHDVNTIIARVGVPPPREHHEKRRRAHATLIDAIRELFEVASTLLDAIVSPELHLDSRPRARTELNHHVCLKARLVTIVIAFGAVVSCVDAKISHAKRLEQIAHGVEVAQQPILVCLERRRLERRVA